MGNQALVLDYGAGNLRSVARAVARCGAQALITDDYRALEKAEAVILPGVGAAADTMCNLRDHSLVQPLREYIESDRPFFGICMGLQALFDSSDEGDQECLGILPGKVIRFQEGLKVPHMGWNQVWYRPGMQDQPLFAGIPDGSYFYFVHSFYPRPSDESVVAGWTDYGVRFASVVIRGKLLATQFHPEKSGELGLRLYQNFLGESGIELRTSGMEMVA